MPTTRPRTPQGRTISEPSPSPVPTSALILGAAAYAAAEVGVALAGGFFVWGRAEPLLFLAYRPFLLLIAAALVARFGARDRLRFYAAALILAASSETLLLLGLGASDPWPQTLRGLAGGAALLLPFDLLFGFGGRMRGRWVRPVLTLALAALLLTPFGLRGYELILLGDTRPRAAEARPDLMLMTALPIIWGETGAFDPASRPAAAFTALQREFAVRPLDVLDEASLSGGRLLLLAQPRALAPEELVALDAWVRRGGRALILTDPALVWPSALALGDARRPPPVGLLGPILGHWGLALEAPATRSTIVEERSDGGAVRRLAMAAPGTFAVSNRDCRLAQGGRLARCRIGDGRAMLLADADLLHDSLWTAPGESGWERRRRLADNPLVVADLLDLLAGVGRPRVDGDVRWLEGDAQWVKALILGALPLLLTLVLAGVARLRRRS